MVANLKRFKDWLMRNIHWLMLGFGLLIGLLRRGSAGGLPNLDIAGEKEGMTRRKAEKAGANSQFQQVKEAIQGIDARKESLDQQAQDLDVKFEASKQASAGLKERSRALREKAKKAGLLGIILLAALLVGPMNVSAEAPPASLDELKAKYLEALNVIAEQDALLQAYEAENDKLIAQCEEFRAQRDQYKALYEELRLKVTELTALTEKYKALYEEAETKAELYLTLYEELHKLYLKLAAPKLRLGADVGYDGGFAWEINLGFEVPLALP